MSSAAVMLADTVAEESKSVLASLITQMINLVRTIVAYAMDAMRRFVQWSGDNPIAAINSVALMTIWVS